MRGPAPRARAAVLILPGEAVQRAWRFVSSTRPTGRSASAFGAIAGEPRVFLPASASRRSRRSPGLPAKLPADAILVAGDVFDTHAVGDRRSARTLNAMEAFDGPWVLLPGNHDAALAESPWTRIERFGRPDNVHLAHRARAARAARRPPDDPAGAVAARGTRRRSDRVVRCRAERAGRRPRRPRPRQRHRLPARGGRGAEPDRPRPGAAGEAGLSGAWRLARHAADQRAHLVRRHAGTRPLQGQRPGQRADRPHRHAGRAAGGQRGRARRTIAGTSLSLRHPCRERHRRPARGVCTGSIRRPSTPSSS